MGNWFGDLQLAYKYTVVFMSLLLITLVAGFTKLFIDRRKLKKLTAKQLEAESGPGEEQMELNQREKDEGDLFGVRAIEAGFYAGIPQSRPTSRAGSVAGSPAMSSTTLIAALNSPKLHDRSMASSVTSLPLAHTNERSRDSETLPSEPSQRRASPPAIKLRPSEAELSRSHNHNVAVDMKLHVPPSPVLARGPTSPHFGGSDSGESDGRASPASPSFAANHYVPVAPQIPMPQGLRASVVEAEDPPKSHAASFNDPSPAHSPPPSPGHAPTTKLPAIPQRALSDDSRTQYQAYSPPQARVEQPVDNSFRRPSSTILLQPQTYQPSHQRDPSSASSVYSEKRASAHQALHERVDSTGSDNYTFLAASNRTSVATTNKEQSRRSASSSFLTPGSAAGADKTNDPRFSEFYDAYYRNSQINPGQKADTSKRPHQLNLTEITEIESPLPSPQPPIIVHQPGLAI